MLEQILEQLDEKKLMHAKKMINLTYEEAINHYFTTKQWMERMSELTSDQQSELTTANRIVYAHYFLQDDNEFKTNVIAAVKIDHRASREKVKSEMHQLKLDTKKKKYHILTTSRKQKLKEYKELIEQCEENEFRARKDKVQCETKLLNSINEKVPAISHVTENKQVKNHLETFIKQTMKETKNEQMVKNEQRMYSNQIPSSSKALSEELTAQFKSKENAENVKKQTRENRMNLVHQEGKKRDQVSSFDFLSNQAKQQVDEVIYAKVDLAKKKQKREKEAIQNLHL